MNEYLVSPQEEEKKTIIKEAERSYSRLGFALLTIGLINLFISLILSVFYLLYSETLSALLNTDWFPFVYSTAPFYLIAIPVGYCIMRRIPAARPEEHSFGAGRFWRCFLISISVMFFGSLLGNYLSELLSHDSATNALDSLAMSSSPLKIIVMVLLGPIIEELVFRRFLIDRCARFGERQAILFSALAFGLFHMNLYQTFYSFGIGLLLGYVYIRTGRLRYPAMLHMMVNFIGSVVGPWVLQLANYDTLAAEGLTGKELVRMLPGILILLAYELLYLGAVIAGFILLCIYFKKAYFQTAPDELPKGSRISAVYGNAGVIVFIVFSAMMTLRSVM